MIPRAERITAELFEELTGGASSTQENGKRDTRKRGRVMIFQLADTRRLEKWPNKNSLMVELVE